MFFDGWGSVGKIIVTAAAIYIAVLFVLRVTGKQALAKMSAYDLIVTVALGSLLASIPVSAAITVTDGLAAIGTYLVLQELTRVVVKRSRRARRIVKEAPTLVLWDGRLLHDRLGAAKLTEEEVQAAVRRSGKASYSEVLAVVLENDGDWSVIPYSDATDLSALQDLDLPAVETQYSLRFDGWQPARRGARNEGTTVHTSGHI